MNLKEQVLKGGAYLMARQTLSMAIGLGGIVALTRLIGPANYGLAASAIGIAFVLGRIGRLGIDTYLVRSEDDPTRDQYAQAFVLLGLVGVSAAALGFLLLPALDQWFGDDRFIPPLRMALLALPVMLAAAPAMAKLERDLDYRAVAFTELAGQIANYAVALAIAVAFDGGVWAPIAGFWAMQLTIGWRSLVLARWEPRLIWSRPLLRDMLRYGLGFSASSWIWQLRSLVNPLVVGRFLGPEGVAFVNVAIRIVEMMSFVRGVAWRLAVPALAKVQSDVNRLRRGIEEAMPLQVLAVGPALAGFAFVGPFVMPALFGSEWKGALNVYPFVALGYLVNSTFNMHSSVLYVLRQNRGVAIANALHVFLFAATALLLVPRFDLIGYGLAEVVAMASYVVIHRRVRRIFDFSYARVWPWLVSFAPPLFAPFVPVPWDLALWLPLLVVVLLPPSRRQLREYAGYVRLKTA